VKRDNGRAYQNFLAGITGPVFVPHIITVADGEVSHQISLPAEMCLITILPEQSWKFTSLNALVWYVVQSSNDKSDVARTEGQPA